MLQFDYMTLFVCVFNKNYPTICYLVHGSFSFLRKFTPRSSTTTKNNILEIKKSAEDLSWILIG